MAQWYCNNGDGLTTGYWNTAPWQQVTSYGTGVTIRPLGGQWWMAVAIDFTAGNIWFRDITQNGLWNDIIGADPGTNTNGIAFVVAGALFPAASCFNFSTFTANFGASAFLGGTLPTGFSSANTAAAATVTWNPADKNANVALTNGNLTASGQGNAGSSYVVRATNSFAAGKVYYEVMFAWQTGSGPYVRDQTNLPQGSQGYANATLPLTTAVGGDLNSIGWVMSSGLVLRNNANQGTLHVISPMAVGNERCYTNLGGSFTSGRAMPSFNGALGNGATVADGSGTWTETTGKVNSPVWYGCWARMDSLWSQRGASGDTMWVGDNHTQRFQGLSGTITLGGSGNTAPNWYSVDHTAAPSSATLTPGATLSFYNSGQTIGGSFYLNGFNLVQGPGSINGPMTLGSGHIQRYTNCNLSITNTGAGAAWGLSSGGNLNQNDLRFDNCNFSNITANAQVIAHFGGRVFIRGGSATSVGASGHLFYAAQATNAGWPVLEDMDLSGITGAVASSITTGLNIQLTRCKLPNSIAFLTQNNGFVGYHETNWFNCDVGANVQSHGRSDGCGYQFQEKVVVRSGGASDGLISYSEQLITTGVGTTYTTPFRTIQMDIWNTVINTNRVVTIYGVLMGQATGLTNAEMWMEVKHLGDAASMLGSLVTSMTANPLIAGTTLPADTSAWDSLVPLRQNTHAYIVGDIVKVASNPGRIFVCGSAGTTAGSPPAGYATATDGVNTIDGGAQFRAGYRFAMSVTLSAPQPKQVGIISIQAFLARNSSRVYIDPLPVLS